MSDLREAAQQALEALEEYQSNGAPFLACDGAVDALRAALAQGCYIAQDMTRQEYERLYPDAEEEVK